MRLSFGHCPKGWGVQPESKSFEVVLFSLSLTFFWTLNGGEGHPCLKKFINPKKRSKKRILRFFICHLDKLHSQILATWNFITNHDIVPWIGEELHIGAEFQEFSRNDKYVRVPGKLSEIHSKVPMFSNPGDKVQKCVKTRRQICPVI